MDPKTLEYGCIGIITGGDSPTASWWKGSLVCWDSPDKNNLVFTGGTDVPDGLEVEIVDAGWRLIRDGVKLTAVRTEQDPTDCTATRCGKTEDSFQEADCADSGLTVKEEP